MKLKLHNNNYDNNDNNDDHHRELTAYKHSVRVLECFPPYFDFGDDKEKEDDNNNNHVLSRIVTRKSAPHTRGSYNGTMNELTTNSIKIPQHISDKGISDSINVTPLYTILFLRTIHNQFLFQSY